MISLLIAVLLVIIFGKLVNAVGKDPICETGWELVTKVAPSAEFKNLRTAQRKAIDLHTERANTSSKDEFAKWAKLDRDYNKTKTEIENINGRINSTKATFNKLVKGLLFVATTGAKMYVRIKYRKEAVFWLPSDVFPKTIMWFMAFSSAPMGAVGVSVWLFVANKAIDTLIGGYQKINAFSKQVPQTTSHQYRKTIRETSKLAAASAATTEK